MLALLRTYVDIIALRKGPEHLPHSWLVLSISLLLMVLAGYASAVLAPSPSPPDYRLVLGPYALSLVFYGGIVWLAGHPPRVLPVLAAVIGCGAIISFLMIFSVQLLPLAGRELVALFMLLCLAWTIPVEGHIMARALDQRLSAGLVIAALGFLLQHGLPAVLTTDG